MNSHKITTIIIYFNCILSSFLLFVLELFIGKQLLSSFGGVYSVWAGAITFFQIILFLGYVFSYQLIQSLSQQKIKYLLIALLFFSLLFLPNLKILDLSFLNLFPFIVKIIFSLFLSIGIVSFILSTSTILLHATLSEHQIDRHKSIISLYGISNIGAFLGLFFYVFFLEYYFDIQTLLNYWKFCFLLYLTLQIYLIYSTTFKMKNQIINTIQEIVTKKTKLVWILYSAGAVLLYLSVTNIITYEILPMPLLWTLPLAIYLLTFILVFNKNPWYPNIIKNNTHLIYSCYILYYFLINKNGFISAQIKFIFILIIFFALLIIIQNALILHQPKNMNHIPMFYIFIALGGTIGGIILSWIIPLIFPSFIEILLPLFIVLCAEIVISFKKNMKLLDIFIISIPVLLFLFFPYFIKIHKLFIAIGIFFILSKIFLKLKTKPFLLVILVVLLILFEKPIISTWFNQFNTITHRNYYGIYTITNQNDQKLLYNGSIIHGIQNINKIYQSIPLSYYHIYTPIGKLLSTNSLLFKNVAFIGVGTGSLAAYQQPFQTFDFIDIDPDVYTIAKNYFSFLNNNQYVKRYFVGDGRKILSSFKKNSYDLIVLDAFSGDSVPIHLLTTEAINLYFEHLTENGTIIFHTSNKFLDLKHVLYKNSQYLKIYSCSSYNSATKNNRNKGYFSSKWFAITKSNKTNKILHEIIHCENEKNLINNKINRPWTDQYSSLLSIFKM